MVEIARLRMCFMTNNAVDYHVTPMISISQAKRVSADVCWKSGYTIIISVLQYRILTRHSRHSMLHSVRWLLCGALRPIASFCLHLCRAGSYFFYLTHSADSVQTHCA